MKHFKTFFKTTVGMKPQSETGSTKKADVSKEELREELKKHEARETPAQERAESKEEQEVESEAGVEKKASDLAAEHKYPDMGKSASVRKLAAAVKLADDPSNGMAGAMRGAFGGSSTPAPTPAPADVSPSGSLGSKITAGLGKLMGG